MPITPAGAGPASAPLDDLRMLEEGLALAQVGVFSCNIVPGSGTGPVCCSANLASLLWVEAGQEQRTFLKLDEYLLPEDAERYRRIALAARRAGHPYRIEVRYRRPDGTLSVLREEARLVHVPGGAACLVGALQDVTAAREREAQLERARDRVEHQASKLADLADDLEKARRVADEARLVAEAASRAKSEFLAHMSHELRTPLNAIIGFSEIIQQEIFGPVGNPYYIEYAGDVLTSARHLLELINELLDLAKIEAGRFDLQEKELAIELTIEACLRLVRERALLKRVTLLPVLGSLPPMLADERALRQILLNLLTNAIKFTPEGGKVRLEAALESDGWLEVRVADTGIGIAPKELMTVLKPFAQGSNISRQPDQGTGLGLPICAALVQLHGGSLAIDSQLGEGTIVTVRFPPDRIVHR